MLRVLVTGGAGFIGSNLVDRLIADGFLVDVLDAFKVGSNPKNCNKFATYHKIDLADKKSVEELFSKNRFDQVYHLASESHVDRSIQDAQPFIDSNITGTYNLFRILASSDSNHAKILMFSTDEVMGELVNGSFKELDPTPAKNLYSMTKLAQEGIARSFYYTDRLNVIVSRCSNIYGPRQASEKLLPKAILNLLNGKKVPIYGTGKNVREWTFVEDAVDAAIFIMKHGKPFEIIHIGTGIEKENIEVVDFLLSNLGLDKSSLEFVADRKGHDLRYSIDFQKITNMGWKHRTSFEEGIKKTLEWYKQNRDY